LLTYFNRLRNTQVRRQ